MKNKSECMYVSLAVLLGWKNQIDPPTVGPLNLALAIITSLALSVSGSMVAQVSLLESVL